MTNCRAMEDRRPLDILQLHMNLYEISFISNIQGVLWMLLKLPSNIVRVKDFPIKFTLFTNLLKVKRSASLPRTKFSKAHWIWYFSKFHTLYIFRKSDTPYNVANEWISWKFLYISERSNGPLSTSTYSFMCTYS